jgi:hypothetical protein
MSKSTATKEQLLQAVVQALDDATPSAASQPQPIKITLSITIEISGKAAQVTPTVVAA